MFADKGNCDRVNIFFLSETFIYNCLSPSCNVIRFLKAGRFFFNMQFEIGSMCYINGF